MYTVRWAKRTGRQLRRVDPHDREVILDAGDSLANDPRPPGHRPLKGPMRGLTRIPVLGDRYRIAYVIDDEARSVTIEQVGTRENIY